MFRAIRLWRAKSLLKKCTQITAMYRDYARAAQLAGKAVVLAKGTKTQIMAAVLQAEYTQIQGNSKEAVAYWRHAIKLGAGALPYTHRKLARALLKEEDFAGAIEHAKRSLDVDGPAGVTFLILADAHYARGDRTEARSWFERALGVDVTDSHAYDRFVELGGDVAKLEDHATTSASSTILCTGEGLASLMSLTAQIGSELIAELSISVPFSYLKTAADFANQSTSSNGIRQPATSEELAFVRDVDRIFRATLDEQPGYKLPSLEAARSREVFLVEGYLNTIGWINPPDETPFFIGEQNGCRFLGETNSKLMEVVDRLRNSSDLRRVQVEVVAHALIRLYNVCGTD